MASFCSASLHAEGSYKTNGGEYAIVGALPSEQVHPAVAIKPDGGYIAWQDRATDGDGFGIRAVRLDSGFSKTLSPFRVNETAEYDQEKPSVANLKDGGAVFAWQGGKPGSQNIYARFMGSDKVWRTSELTVSSGTAEFRLGPKIAVLNNGNVVIVWASYNQGNSGTMQDVYGQIFTPTGVKVGAEFRVNDFPAYNQRTPALAALANGGFVVVWISEMQRVAVVDSVYSTSQVEPELPSTSAPSVDVYAKLFTAAGAGASSEILVNTVNRNCANPAVAAASDGGFCVVWNEMDTKELTNGWDVFSRKFQSATSAGLARRVNSMVYGEQFAPQISSSGPDFFVVWTSLGQDGAMEGAYGQFLANDGAHNGGEFRVNTVTLSKQIHPAVATDGAGQFLVAWAGYVGGAQGFDLFAQRYAEAGSALQPMDAPWVYVPFVLVNGASYQPRINVSWPSHAGLPIDHYEVYADGAATATASTRSNHWAMTAADGLQATSTHKFSVAYVLSDGRKSPVSAQATATTWGGSHWWGIPFEWMEDNFGADVSAWPPASRVMQNGGPSVLQIFASGGDPKDAGTWLKTRLAPTSQGMFLTWNPQPGFIYQVQKSTDLAQWQNVGGQRLATGAQDSMMVVRGNSCYYRVLLMR